MVSQIVVRDDRDVYPAIIHIDALVSPTYEKRESVEI